MTDHRTRVTKRVPDPTGPEQPLQAGSADASECEIHERGYVGELGPAEPMGLPVLQ